VPNSPSFISNESLKLKCPFAAVNMMMIALPSLNRQIKRYERHKRALEEVEGGELEYELSSSDSLSEDVRILTNDFLSEVPTNNSK
jgi:hypothetical protein